MVQDAGYFLFEEKPWHWEVTNSEGKIVVHVWPTVGKYMVAHDSGASFYGNDLLGCLARCFEPKVAVPEFTEDRIEAERATDEHRKNFMSDWGNEEQV